MKDGEKEEIAQELKATLENELKSENLDYWCQSHALEISLDDCLYYRMKSKLNKKVL